MKNIKSYTQTLNEAEGQNALNKKLMDAAEKGNTNIVADLLDMGAQVDARNPFGWTVLHWAARNGKTDVSRLLLDRGAQVDARGADDWTPLYWAATNGHTDTAMLLILNGADHLKAFKDPANIIEFFKGNIDWWPEGEPKAKLKRMARGKQAFGM